MKGKLEGRTPTEDVSNKWTALLDKLREAWASVEKVGAQVDEVASAIPQAHKWRNLFEADLERAKANELELQGKFIEIKASSKKARDSVSLLKIEVANLDATPKLLQKKWLKLKQQGNMSKNF